MTAEAMVAAEPWQTDVAIVGGGMAGIALALLLADHCPSLHVTLIEQHAFKASPQQQLAMPSFDARATALSHSTTCILESLGVWSHLLPHAQPIDAVHVSERGRAAGMLMQASEMALPALGHIVENRFIGHGLLAALQARPAIHCLGNSQTRKVSFSSDAAVLSVATPDDVREMHARLVVIADGTQSALRQQLGIAVDRDPYDQRALIANIALELPHRGVAYERFTENGPLALLPLPDCDGRPRSALVWTVPEAEADALLALPEAEFLAQVQSLFGQRCGRLLSLGERNSYPLALMLAREQVRSRLVLVGNAAHSMHPVAGQGFNLILRDCYTLTEVLVQALREERSIGELAVLQRYLDQQLWDQQKVITTSDVLPRLFSTSRTPQKVLRTAALLGLDFLPGARQWFAGEATGLGTAGVTDHRRAAH